MLHTSLCTLLNIQLPIIQAPIGSATSPELVAAVSNAGGLGMLALSWRTLEECRQLIRETRRLTNLPFGINLVLEWSQVERLKVCLEEEVKIVSFFWGNPEPYIQIAHDSGAVVLHAVASASEAKQAVEAGVDVIVAQGWEASGHVWGKVATFALVPSIVDVVSSIPVVAAGGIADGRGIAAALALGASGVWMGTRFLVSDEASVHPLYKQKIIEATEDNTVYSTLFDIGWSNAPHRTLRNSTVSNWEAAGSPPISKRPNEGEIIAAFADRRQIERYSDVIPLPGMSGDVEALALYAGQSAGLISGLQPAGEIVRQLAAEAADVLTKCAALV